MKRGRASRVYRSVRRGRWMVTWGAGALAALLLVPRPGAADGPDPRAEARSAFHLENAQGLYQRWGPAVYEPCRRFPTPAAWDAHVDAIVDHGITFAAHLGEAWEAAKATRDEAVQARVKAARRQMLRGNPVGLVTKFSHCAMRNGSTFNLFGLWRHVVAEVPRRREAVAREAEAVTPDARRPVTPSAARP